MDLADHPAPPREKKPKRKPLPHQLLWEARQLAGQHHMFILERTDMVRGQPVTVYIVYREPMYQQPKLRLGKSRNPDALLRKVKQHAKVIP